MLVEKSSHNIPSDLFGRDFFMFMVAERSRGVIFNLKLLTQNTLHRFSNRVGNYVKSRPSYPEELISFLKQQEVLKDNSVIADIGSGTGISCDLFLQEGLEVYGIEPNQEMREAAKRSLCKYEKFHSINATAENTSLSDKSIDVIVAAQAFHWFDQQKCKTEFKRVLKNEGKVVLMWNDRRTDTTDFLKVYEDFLQMFGTDYAAINHKNVQNEGVFNNFFGKGNYESKSFYNFQDLDFEGLKGRVLSSSYMPNEGHTDYEFMMYCLKKIFLRYQEKGTVRLDYDTKIYYGTIK